MLLSGQQVEIAFDDQRAVVTTVGATLRQYAVGNRPVLDGFDADEVCPGGRGQLLVPWPNRIADGRYEVSGRRLQLPIDEPELGHAIHGLVRWDDWRIEHHGADRAQLRHLLPARPGYPFPLDVAVEYSLSPRGLSVTFRATNVGSVACPFGAGAHPYFMFSGARVDAIELSLPARQWLEVDERSIPQEHRPVERGPLDFLRPRLIGAALLDHGFTALERDQAGLAQVLLRHGGEEVRIWLDRSFAFLQVFTGDTLPDRARRRHGLAVEPMICPANAFNSGDGLRVLDPGETFEGRWGIVASSRAR